MSNFLQEKPHKALMEAIKEYLSHQGYVQVLKVLEVISKQIESVPESTTTLHSLLSSMEQGDSSAFFRLWPSVCQGSTVQLNQLQEIEFFVRVFFTIFPLHQICNSKRESAARYKRNMEEFKVYLEQEGKNFSRSEEILSYFALPYMPNPQEHPAFKHIFTMKWFNTLKDKLRVLVGKEDLQNAPILQKMYEKYIDPDRQIDTKVTSQVNVLEKQLSQVNAENEKLRQRILRIEAKYEEFVNGVLGISKEMFDMLESVRLGDKMDEDKLDRVYEDLRKYDKDLKRMEGKEIIEQPAQINFAIVIKDLTTLQDDLKICALLQALRWRLTRTHKAEQRENLENYIKFNILCTQKPHDSLLDNLLNSTRRVKEYTMRFLNVVSTDKSGRLYILQKENIVSLLVQIISNEKQDTGLRQNSLGVLQKLSLKKTAQIDMIQLDVLDWLLKILKVEIDSISEYTLEYATALLMNLSLRTLGKEKLCKYPSEVINLLLKFTSHENNQVRTYINGTLYSILTKKPLKDAAIRQGIEKKLKSLVSKSDENIKRQINFILEQLHQKENDCQTDEGEEEIEEIPESGSGSDGEPDEFEDLDDLITVPSILTGEALLRAHYDKSKQSQKKPEESKQPITLSSKRQEQDRKKSFKKETTEYSQGFSSRDKIPRTPYQS